MSSYRDHVEQVRAAHSVEALLTERYQHPVDNHTALCPFHADANPSLSTTDRVYHCFACQAGGDVFHLVQHLEHKAFTEAVALLAELAGLPPYHQSAADRLALELERQTGDVTEWAALYYTSRLTPEARDYLMDGRRLPQLTVLEARCGWADGGLVEAVCRGGGDARMLVNAGLAVAPRGQNTWAMPEGSLARDWLHERVTFPSLEKGRAIFLSGRTLTKDVEPKYLHQKGRPAPLYNVDALVGATRVLVTEGQVDTLSLMAWGLPVVGLLGTPHAAHLAALRRVPEVFLCLDGDTAGRRAALKLSGPLLSRVSDRAITLAAALGPLRTKIIPLPDGEDPNDVYRTRPKAEFLAWIEAARDPVEFALQAVPVDQPTRQDLLPFFALLTACSPLEQHAYLSGPVTTWAQGQRRLVKAVEAEWRAHAAGPQKCPSCGAPIGGHR